MYDRSEFFLTHVHPDLCRVIRTAAQTPQPFVVVYGLRTLAAEEEAVRTHHSMTLHSRHLANKNGLSCAVDVAALIDNKISFAPGKEAEIFGQIWQQIRAAATALPIPVDWGGDWLAFKDWGHIQLPWEQYP